MAYDLALTLATIGVLCGLLAAWIESNGER